MCRTNHFSVKTGLWLVVLVAMQWHLAEAASPFRFLRELFENTAKHADDTAKHIDDAIVTSRPEVGVVSGATRAARAASRMQNDERRQEQDAFGHQEWCGIAAGICLISAAYLLLAPKLHSHKKNSRRPTSL